MFANYHREEESTVTELLEIKSVLEGSIQDLNEMKKDYKQRLADIREQKRNLRREKAENLQNFFKNKILVEDSQQELEIFDDYCSTTNRALENATCTIRNLMKLTQFEEQTVKLNNKIEGAIVFYSEDNLQIELMKKANAVRERRVELTKVENDYKELLRDIEAHKREKERAHLAELERIRQEEECQRRLEEEKILAEEVRHREEFRQNLLIEKEQAFLGNHSTSNSTAAHIQQQLDNSTESSAYPPAFDGPQGKDSNLSETNSSAAPRGFSIDLNFSQFLHW